MDQTKASTGRTGITDKEDISEEREIKPNINPLEIPMVVEIVCGYIHKVKDLKSLQTLGRPWRKETFKKWRSSAIFLINNETLLLLLRAFSEPNWDNLNDEEKSRIDPFQLRQVPFKKYRFSSDQFWSYPPGDNELDKKLIWKKVISPNATYLDIGESAIRFFRTFESNYYRKNYNLGLEWIIAYSPNVTELALAPIKSNKEFRAVGKFNRIISARNLVSMTISSPRQPAQDGDGGGSPSQSLFDRCTREIATSIFCMTPRLKNLTLNLTSKRQGLNVMQGMLKEMDGGPIIFLNSFNSLGIKDTWIQHSLHHYVDIFSPTLGPLQELRMTFPVSNCLEYCDPRSIGLMYKFIFGKLEKKLTKLELEIDCEVQENQKLQKNTDLYLRWYTFSKLTHFKVNLDFITFTGRLLTFDLNDLKGMPSLQKFHFGTKGSLVNKPWITRKLDFVEDPSQIYSRKVVRELPHLKSFHFHGNFTKEALQWLGGMAGNIKTLEVVLDEENFSAVKEIWPGLRNLKLLACSNVPEEDVTTLEESNLSWNVINDSAKYLQCSCIEAGDMRDN